MMMKSIFFFIDLLLLLLYRLNAKEFMFEGECSEFNVSETAGDLLIDN